jgi:hypothetical protein
MNPKQSTTLVRVNTRTCITLKQLMRKTATSDRLSGVALRVHALISGSNTPDNTGRNSASLSSTGIREESNIVIISTLYVSTTKKGTNESVDRIVDLMWRSQVWWWWRRRFL